MKIFVHPWTKQRALRYFSSTEKIYANGCFVSVGVAGTIGENFPSRLHEWELSHLLFISYL